MVRALRFPSGFAWEDLDLRLAITGNARLVSCVFDDFEIRILPFLLHNYQWNLWLQGPGML